MDDLYYLSLGPYQIRNAISYYAEHQKEGIFLVQKFNPRPKHPSAALNYEKYGISVEEPTLIKAHMKSRYRSGKYHYIFVLIDKAKTERDSIREYYCTCESGARTAGCCSHVMTIVWFLGIVNCKLHISSSKQLCVFFTPIDSSHYFVRKSIKVR